MKIRIHVTKEILRKSNCAVNDNYVSNCMVATALKGMFPTATVGSFWLCLISGVPTSTVKISDFLQSKIDDFDRCSNMEDVMNLPEFSFEIEVPSAVIDKIGISSAYKILSESKTLELVHP